MGLFDLLKEAVRGTGSGEKGKTLTCTKCGEVIPAGKGECPKCRTPVKEMFKFSCPKCKGDVDYERKKCTQCGYDFAAKEESKTSYTCPICSYKADYRMLSCPSCGTKFM